MAVTTTDRPTLTDAQRKALRLFGDGLTKQQVADEFGVSVGTAKYFADVLRRKFGVEHQRELVTVARNYFGRD